ncbi:MAG: tetratricopeptide repeat protein [Ferruginibacter sp.]
MKNLATTAAFAVILSLTANSQDSSLHYFNKGIEEKNAKHWMVAAKYFDKSISFNDKNVQAYVENGLVNQEMRRTDFAKLNFNKAYELDPGNKTAISELMKLNYNYRQWAKAIEMADKCSSCEEEGRIRAMSYYQLEDYPKAEKGLLKILASNPADAQLNYTLAKVYLEMEASPKAYPYFKKAIELDTTKVSWMVEFADENYEAQHYKDAVIYYSKALDHGYTASNEFNTDLGFSYIYSMEYQKGEDLIKKVIEKNPGKKDLYRDVADAFYNRKMYDKSLDYCQKLLELDPNDAKALYQAGLSFQKKGQKDKGQGMCDKAIQMDPSLANLRKKVGGDSGF